MHDIRNMQVFADCYNSIFGSEISRSQQSSSALALDTLPLFLLVHSGSRGVGQGVLASTQSETQRGAQPLVEGTPEFDAYLNLHDDACRWARCNRDLIAHRIMACIDPSYSIVAGLTTGEAHRAIRPYDITSAIKSRKLIDIWHNVRLSARTTRQTFHLHLFHKLRT